MKEYFAEGKTLTEAYHKALIGLEFYGEESECTDWNTTQIEISMTMYVRNPLEEPLISKCFIGGPRELEQYRMEMLDGILDFEVEKGNWVYTYHRRFADQIPFVISELKRNHSSRRAVMLVRDNKEDMFSEEPACMQHIQYFIRENKLDCMVLFRSNDACKAAFMNAFALIMLQKRIADELGIEVGTYTHRANSFHCYQKDRNMLIGYVDRISTATEPDDITYEYRGDWDEIMEFERDSILANVEELKNR